MHETVCNNQHAIGTFLTVACAARLQVCVAGGVEDGAGQLHLVAGGAGAGVRAEGRTDVAAAVPGKRVG